LPGNLTAASRRESFSRKQELYSPAPLNDTVSNPELGARPARRRERLALERRSGAITSMMVPIASVDTQTANQSIRQNRN
jgi:hypothetical protein